MKRYNRLLLLIVVLTISFLFVFDSKKTDAALGESALEAYAFELRLLR